MVAGPAPAAAGGGLPSALDRALAVPGLSDAGVGVHVVDVGSGQTVYERNADRRFNPASGIKLITTAAALDVLGPDHVFVTRALAAAAPSGGVVAGDIALEGGGDPTLTTGDLWRLARLVRASGVTEVTGGVVLDGAWFDGDKTPPRFDKKDTDHAYRAYVGAAATDFGTLQVRVAPGAAPGAPVAVTVDPPGAPVTIDNTATTAAGHSRLVVSTVPLPGQDRVVVRGSLPPDGRLRSVLRRTEFPDEVAAHAFRALLVAQGVKVHGSAAVSARPVVTDAWLELGRHASDPLCQVIAPLNQWSNNFMAEMLLKGIGAKAGGRPGSAAKGAQAVGEFLARLGVPKEAFTITNGSGLYDANEVTPRAMTAVLTSMWRRPDVGLEYAASLAVGGRHGTLQSRLQRPPSLVGRVRAKTGTLAGAVSLSGYAFPDEGGPYAFVVLMNGLKGLSAGRQAADRIAQALATP